LKCISIVKFVEGRYLCWKGQPTDGLRHGAASGFLQRQVEASGRTVTEFQLIRAVKFICSALGR
jgi:hypothetical protein